MYSTCIFCHGHLGTNSAIEPFPVGRRLAFDSAKGRLWVICPACGRWNLSPLEERWEATEECERQFRVARLRVATNQIGLARLREGLELVRIGAPLRPELAAWRYGPRFLRRWRTARWRAGVGAVAGVVAWGTSALFDIRALTPGAVIFAAGIGGAWWWRVREALREQRRLWRPLGIVTADDGREVQLHGYHATRYPGTGLRLSPGAARGADIPLRLRLSLLPPHLGPRAQRLPVPSEPQKDFVFSGDAVRPVLRLLMPSINRQGGRTSEVEAAVARLEAAGAAERYFGEAAAEARAAGQAYDEVANLPKPVQLALEMATQEEDERRAMDGELALLEAAWREAEQIAAIADDLLIPPEAEELMRQLRAGRPDRVS